MVDRASTAAPALGELWRRVKAAPLDAGGWLALAGAYAAAGQQPWQAGHVARQALRLDAALRPALEALSLGPWRQWPSPADAALGRPAPDADAPARAGGLVAWLARQPGDWLGWLYLARLLEMGVVPMAPPEFAAMPQPGDTDGVAGVAGAPDAAGALREAITHEPIAGESLHMLGVWRLNAGDAAGAVQALAGLVDLRPLRHGSMAFLGEALLRVGKVEAAEKAFTRASMSNNVAQLQALAARVYAHNYWQEAMATLRKALSLQPDDVPCLLALARIQSDVYHLADCAATLARLQQLAPQAPELPLLAAGLQGRLGDARGHLARLQALYENGGDPLSRLASSVAMTALYHDGLAPAEVAALHRRLCAPIEAAVTRRRDFARPREATRRLRLGLVTGDLHRQHPVNLFMLPMLERFDRGEMDIAVFHTGTMHDEYTRRARAAADTWLEAAALDDAALREAIVADGVDVLVDLAGHTATHRLGVFAQGAAPVQASFLGYPHSTGLTAIDWLIGDATVSPAAHAGLYSEGIAQLPGCVFCWAPVDEHPLPPARPPGVPVVFGSFNNAMKLSPRTLALWAQVLHAVPGSRLLLKAPAMSDAGVQARFTALLAEQGITADRLDLRGPSGLADMMQAYGEVDIALDPTPYNGGTTTLQALWMGVPVVALAGGNFVSRMGASFLHTLGRDDWVAQDEAAYVQVAARLAEDVDAVRVGRAGLRARVAASPLGDIEAYTAHFQALVRRMWRLHCEGATQRLIEA